MELMGSEILAPWNVEQACEWSLLALVFDWDWCLCVWTPTLWVADAPAGCRGLPWDPGRARHRGVLPRSRPRAGESRVFAYQLPGQTGREQPSWSPGLSDIVVVLGTVAGNSFSW